MEYADLVKEIVISIPPFVDLSECKVPRDGDYIEALNGAHLNQVADFSLFARICKSWKRVPLKAINEISRKLPSRVGACTPTSLVETLHCGSVVGGGRVHTYIVVASVRNIVIATVKCSGCIAKTPFTFK